eukprot:GCRY01000625.1.p1 GENE.GCRY01000625.1~~GCRY01000625.1.p1  ORF type:complete len:399 (-),score=127.00 GCRY01000625.1:37-1233(-)
MKLLVCMLLGLIALSSASIFFQETFDDATWEDRWIQSESKSDYGKFKLSHGKWYGDEKADLGIQTSQDARFYSLSTAFDEFSNEGKDLIISFTVKHEQKIDCGGGYIKLLPSSLDSSDFNGDSLYYVMAGPDICGATKKVHFIFHYNGKNLEWNKKINCETDELTHLYTFIIHPDNTYEVEIDQKNVASGSLEEDWDFLPPKEIPDPAISKPEDWVDEKYIDDPEDSKPEDWVEEANIADPEAEMPEDWDEELDGEWEAPLIPNPEYQGEWKPRKIKNPEYQGEWEHPMIANPEYVADSNLYLYKDIGAVGFDLWQVKSGTIFDNILVTDSKDELEEFVEDTYLANKDGEKAMFDEIKAEERKQQEEERKRQEEAMKDMEEEEEEDFEEDDEDFHDEL